MIVEMGFEFRWAFSFGIYFRFEVVNIDILRILFNHMLRVYVFEIIQFSVGVLYHLDLEQFNSRSFYALLNGIEPSIKSWEILY